MNVLRHIHRWFGGGDPYESDRDPRAGYVSQAVLRHHERTAQTRGIDFVTWRTPKEVNQMRRLERRAALRMIKKGA